MVTFVIRVSSNQLALEADCKSSLHSELFLMVGGSQDLFNC